MMFFQAQPDTPANADPTSEPESEGSGVESAGAELSEIEQEATQDIQALWEDFQSWGMETIDSLLSASAVYQIIAIIVAVGLGWLLSRRPEGRLKRLRDNREQADFTHRIYNVLVGIIWPAFVVILLWASMFAFSAADQPNGILRVAASLTNAAIVVRLITRNMEEGPLRTLIAWTAWGIAALYILDLLDPLTNALRGASIPLGGDVRLTFLDILTSLVLAVVALWVGRFLGDAAQSSLRSSSRLTPSMSGLLGQVAKIGLMILAFMIALQVIGIPLTAFAFVSGAIAFGVGFGLQSIFSNFISGIIILLEKSIKVGDFIELQSGVRGQVKEINIRSTLVNTNDDIDILVPNEEFIKAQVINWTLRDPRRRLRVPFGVAYGTDKETVKKAGLEAAAAVDWTIKKGERFEPSVWLVEFGDSSLNYELVVWLKESAVKRPARVLADYNWALHTALEKYDLEIPFPQRDINLRQPDPITVTVKK